MRVGAEGSWRSHRMTSPSPPLVAKVVPSGLNLTEDTVPVWPVRNGPMRARVVSVRSRRMTMLPPLAARVVPSGLNATECALLV